MEHDQEMHIHHGGHDGHYTTIYPPDLHSYGTSPSSFMMPAGSARQRFHPEAFGTSHRHEQHEAEHVFNSPQLTLDPSTLNLRSNSNENENPRPPSANTSGSNSSTPTGSLRLSTYNLQNSLNSNGVITRRRARAQLEQLQIQIQVGVHAEAETQSQDQHQQSDMQDVHMQAGDMQMHLDDRHDSDTNGQSGSGMGHEQGQGGETPHPRNMYTLLPGTDSQQGYYLNSNPEAFTHSPTSPSTPSDGSRDPNIQGTSSTPGLTPPASSSTSIARSFRPGPLSLGIPGSRSISHVASPGQQQLSPSHAQHPQLSSHPHMHPSPYYPISHQSAGSPGFPSTPTTSHHTQGSSSSSHSSGHTRYSLHGSPGPRGFGHRHARSGSFGNVSTMSVRSNSPANSVASAFTSLSGGHGGSAPPSTSGPVGSPTSYGEGADVQMPFVGQSPPEEGGTPPVSSHARSQSHPPLSMPTAQHPALAAYAALLPPPRKSLLQQGTGGYLTTTGERFIEEPPASLTWPPYPEGYATPPPGPRLTEEEFQAQFRPKPIITRAPHRKQKLANSDRKAICMYAKQHPNARQEDIAARYNVERSTISKILKHKERWLGCPDDETKVARKRKPRFDDLELRLKIWVEGTRDQGLVLSDALIRSKAKEEARQLGILEDKFKASSGWLENFKHRVGIRKGKYVGREIWLAASDSEGEEPPQSARPIEEERIIFFAEPPPGYEDAVKGFWRVPIADIQRREDSQNREKTIQASPSEQSPHPASEPPESGQSQTSGTGAPAEAESEYSPTQQQLQYSHAPGPRPASRTEGRQPGSGMRKTRSRTLAEAREAEASLPGRPGSPLGPASPVTALTPAPTVALGPTLVSTLANAAVPAPRPGAGSSHESRPGLSHESSSSSRSPSAAYPPDGRDASAGLDAALDYIGCQPEGFASPEEVAVLQKLQRRMSRAEHPRHHSTSSEPSAWNATGET